MQTSSLDALENSAYRTVVDHGFFDLLLAAAVLAFTLVFAVSPLFVLAVFPLVIFKQPLLRLFNQEVVEPHVGHVRLGQVRMEQVNTARQAAALAFFGLAFVVARLGDLGTPISAAAPMAWLAETPQLQVAIIVGAGTAVAGWLFGLPRFMVYGLLIALAPLVTVIAGFPAGTGWIPATLLILAAGCQVLYRFVRDNPETSA